MSRWAMIPAGPGSSQSSGRGTTAEVCIQKSRDAGLGVELGAPRSLSSYLLMSRETGADFSRYNRPP